MAEKRTEEEEDVRQEEEETHRETIKEWGRKGVEEPSKTQPKDRFRKHNPLRGNEDTFWKSE